MKAVFLHGNFLITAMMLAHVVSAPALAASEDLSPKEVAAEYRQFMKMAGRVSHQEPELVNQPSFNQKFTLKYQRYGGSQEAIAFKMLFSVPPESVKLEQLARAYVKYGKEASALSDQLLPYVREHLSMLTDEKYAANYRGRYNKVLKTIFPDAAGKLIEFSVFDCDYTTQPTDAFWYLIHTMRILDRYGTALYGKVWEKKRDELVIKNRIRSLEEMRAAVEPGLLREGSELESGESAEVDPAK